MYNGVTISVVIPCYNEAAGIGETLRGIPDYVDEIVCVDNNSKDNTVEIARAAGAVVVPEPKQGYGHALLGGFRAATKDVIVTMDGDGTYPAVQIAELVDILEREQLDFITCSRFPLKRKDAMRFRNVVGNYALSLIFGLLYGKWLRDSQSGMWVFRRSILPLMHLEGGSWEFSGQIKIEAGTNPYIKFKEVPIDFYPRYGKSHFHGWLAAIKVGIHDIRWMVAQRFVNRRARQQKAYDSLTPEQRQALEARAKSSVAPTDPGHQ